MVDFLVVAALNKEMSPGVLQVLEAKPLPSQPGQTRIHYAARLQTLPGRQYDLRLLCIGKSGGSSANSAVTKALARWKPRRVILIGIAAVMPGSGRRKGDILVADQIVDIPERKRSPFGPTFRPKTVTPCDPMLVSSARDLHRRRVHVGTVVSQPDLSRDAAYRDALRTHVEHFFGRTGLVVGLEMEGGGLVDAIADSELVVKPPVTLVKGGVDWGNYHKNDRLQAAVATKVARFLRALLAAEPVAPRAAGARSSAGSSAPARRGPHPPRPSVAILSHLRSNKAINIGDVRVRISGRTKD